MKNSNWKSDLGSQKGRGSSKAHLVTFGGRGFVELEGEPMLSAKARKRWAALRRLRKYLGLVRFALWLDASEKKNYEDRQYIWHNGERVRKVEVTNGD